MANGPSNSENRDLAPRPPEKEDFVGLCRELNQSGCDYMIVGGFAIIQAGLPRTTSDVDVLMDISPENERRVFNALGTLPDGCVRELDPGDVAKYTVVRVADEIVVDLMASASGIAYEEGSKSAVVHEIDGVPIPFASPDLLYRMKMRSGREKDRGDIYFLEQLFAAQGRQPPEV